MPMQPRVELAPELTDWTAALAAWSTRNLDAAALERVGSIPKHTREGLADLGVFGITLPEAYGGAGQGIAAACAAVRELARVDRSVATMAGLHLGLGTRGIVSLASEALQREWLPRLASGQSVGAFCATEAGAGSDLASVQTSVRHDGDSVIVSGEKSYVTNGGFADCYTVLARLPGAGRARGHALVLVPASAEGVERGAEEEKLGITASSTVTLALSDVRVPKSHVLGAAGSGLEEAYRLLVTGRTVMAAGCLGTAEAGLEAIQAHLTTRVQFRRTLGELPVVRMQYADALALTFAMGALIRKTAEAIDSGVDAEDLSAKLKVFASETAFAVCDRAIQLHGALGVMEPAGVARLARDCRVTRIFEGANDVLLLRIGAGRALSRRETARFRSTAQTPTEIARAAAHVGVLGARMAAASEQLRSDFGATTIHQQTRLQCIAQADIAQETALAVLEYAAATPDKSVWELAVYASDLLVREGTYALERMEARAECERRAESLVQESLAVRARTSAGAPQSLKESHP